MPATFQTRTRPVNSYAAFGGAPRNAGASPMRGPIKQFQLGGGGPIPDPAVLGDYDTQQFFGGYGHVPSGIRPPMGGGGAPQMPQPQMPAPQMPQQGQPRQWNPHGSPEAEAIERRFPGGPSVHGIYADTLANPLSNGMLPSNLGAQQFYGAHGYMPNKTVGGLWGQHTPVPEIGGAAQQQQGDFFNLGHGGYGAIGQAPLGMAPTDQQGYMQQMMSQNPGGQFFGGALPALGMSAGGQQRPMWMGAPAEESAEGGFPNFLDWRNAHGLPSKRPISVDRQRADAAGHAAYMQNRYGSLDQGTLGQIAQNPMLGALMGSQGSVSARKAGVAANAYNKAQARKSRMGIGDPLDMAMRGNPDIAGMMGMGQLGLQGQQMQNQLGWGQLAQQHQAAQFQQNAALMQHIAGSDLPPGLKQQYMDKLLGGMGLGGAGHDAGTLTGQKRIDWHLTPKQQGEYRALKTPKEREDWLNTNGITDPQTRSYMLGAGGAGMGVQREGPMSYWDRFLNSPISWGLMPTWGASNILDQQFPNWGQGGQPAKPTKKAAPGRKSTVPIPHGASGEWTTY